MNEVTIEGLKKRMLDFVKSQPGYDESTSESITVNVGEGKCVLIYGKDEMAGIMGIGKTSEEAYLDFEESWKELKGFEWIQKNK